jgi:hypothetical protein
MIAFICRTVLLAVYVVLGHYEHEATQLDTAERAVVTCLQVCLLGAAWLVYEVCAFVIRVLSGRISYAPVSLDVPVRSHAPGRCPRDADASSQAGTLDRAPASLYDGDSRAREQYDSDRVSFDSRRALGRYVAQVHVIGIVVWTTMLSIDYALTQTSVSFVLGMLLGNVAWVLSGPGGRAGMPFAVIVVYWGLTGALCLLYLAQDGMSALTETETELGMSPNRFEWSQTLVALVVLLSPASCGFSWTAWMDARAVLAHYHTSLYTSVILSVPVLVFVRGSLLSDILSRYSAPWLAHVVVTEPVLKFMTIYVMTLSLDAESVVEMLTVNASVVGVCYLCFEPHDPSFSAAVAVLVACLLGLHVARLSRRALREMRMSRAAEFVVDDLGDEAIDDIDLLDSGQK